jgi:hypothetical protein
MKKYLYLLIVVLFIASCEKDNICIDPTTPHLIIRFYDKTNTANLKTVTNLKVSVENSLNEIVNIGAITTTDSISLPLNVDVDYSKIYLTKNVNDTSLGVEDSFDLNYVRDEVFVSRSCGYKTIYSNITIDNTSNNWLENIALLFTEVNNEDQAHIKIFH